jgi:hypothetical protein
MPRAIEGLTVRTGGDADIPRVIELMKAALGEGQIPRTPEFWHWKHRENPFGHSPMWVAEKDDALVGVRIFLRWRWRHPGGTAEAVRAVDTSTHPDFQGAGIFKRLTLGLVEEMKLEGVSFVFNTPNSKSRPGYLKMGWQAVGRVPLWIRPRRPWRLALSRFKRPGTSWNAEDTEPADGSLERVLAELAESWSVGVQDAGYRTPADARYLRWRYASCPAASYRAAAVDPRQAFIIYRERTRGSLKELTVCDLFFQRSWRGVRSAGAALKVALRASRSDYALSALRPDPLEALVLSSCGFMPAPAAGPILTVRELAGFPVASDPRKLRSWRASIGDLELF